jgi:DNA-binding beta-propeller fold protein YncE
MLPATYCRMITMLRFTLTALVMTATLLAVRPAEAQMMLESDLFVADRGNVMNGSDGAVHRLNYDGSFVSTLPNAGMGQVRGIDVALDGTVYVARGNDILRYLSPALTPDATPFFTGNKAQNVAVHPVTGNLWCSFGSNPSEAMIVELDATGLPLQTLTGAPLDQPRGLAFNDTGDTLFVANVAGFNVLAIDTTVTPATVAIHAATGNGGVGSFTPIGIALDPSTEVTTLYCTGDFNTTDEVLVIEGDSGVATVSTAFSYLADMSFNAPSGLRVDSWGNLRVACRDRDMSVPGIYCFRKTSGATSQAPAIGSPFINPVDVAFLRRPFSVEITSDQAGDVFDVNGVASVVIGETVQPAIRIAIDAPDYPNSPFVVLFSLLTQGQCANGDPQRPLGSGQIIAGNEARRTPLELDSLFVTSQQMLLASINTGGVIPFVMDPALACPASTPGGALFLFGVTDATGLGETFLSLPTFPAACFPADFAVELGFSAAVVDSFTGPLGIGLVSAAPECLRLFYFSN